MSAGDNKKRKREQQHPYSSTASDQALDVLNKIEPDLYVVQDGKLQTTGTVCTHSNRKGTDIGISDDTVLLETIALVLGQQYQQYR